MGTDGVAVGIRGIGELDFRLGTKSKGGGNGFNAKARRDAKGAKRAAVVGKRASRAMPLRDTPWVLWRRPDCFRTLANA